MRALNRSEAVLASKAFEQLKNQRPDAALVFARQLVAQVNQAPDAQHVLALCLAASGEVAAADAAFEAALHLAPGQAAILANFARFLKRTSRPAQALSCWQRVLQAAPHDGSAFIEVGRIALELGQLEVARQAFLEASRLDPRQSLAWQGLGSALRAQGDIEEAERALRQGLTVDPDSPVLWTSLAGVLRLAGRPQEAVDAYQTRLRCGPHTPEVLDARTGALIDVLRIEDARAQALEVVELHPEYAQGHVTLANLLWEFGGAVGTEADPASEFIKASEARPDDRDLQLALVGFLLSAKRSTEALERIERLRRIADAPVLLALHANALELAERSSEAGQLYAQADAALGAVDVNFNNAYVRHLLKAGRWKEAAERAERSLLLDEDNQETWAYLATAWRLVGDPREDWLCGYEQLVELMPVEPPPGYADMASFLEEVVTALLPLHLASREPVVQSLRHGSQTPGRLFGRPDPRIALLEGTLRQTVERWIARLPASTDGHPFLRRAQRSIRFAGSWSVRLWRSGSHANHFHGEGWMSSAFYVALPPSVRLPDPSAPLAGCLQLGQPPEELGLDLPPRRILQPKEGHLALFPSYLWHGTAPFDDPEPRLTVAFDMLPKA